MDFHVYQVIRGESSIMASFVFVDDALLFAREKSKCDIGYLMIKNDRGTVFGTFEGGI